MSSASFDFAKRRVAGSAVRPCVVSFLGERSRFVNIPPTQSRSRLGEWKKEERAGHTFPALALPRSVQESDSRWLLRANVTPFASESTCRVSATLPRCVWEKSRLSGIRGRLVNGIYPSMREKIGSHPSTLIVPVIVAREESLTDHQETSATSPSL